MHAQNFLLPGSLFSSRPSLSVRAGMEFARQDKSGFFFFFFFFLFSLILLMGVLKEKGLNDGDRRTMFFFFSFLYARLRAKCFGEGELNGRCRPVFLFLLLVARISRSPRFGWAR